EASREVWLAPETGALAAMKKGAIAIESSTLTPDWMRELGNAAAQLDIALLEAPVVGYRPQAEAAQLVFLAAGNDDTLNRAAPVLRNMGKTVHHVGTLGSGALLKLATNALLGVQVTALAELIALLENNGADVGGAIKAMSSTAAWSPAATHLTNSMIAGNFAAQFPVNLIEKDFAYAVGLASSPTMVPTIAAARAVFLRAIEQNLGEKNMTSVVRLFAK
ncbi:MAG: NAD(P)-dependent oxidoreductase, partial [Rhizobiaceae bacterium]|nr:NAD(P)-dependent oxidoreductase [Rhizobiaceae bacterium]